MPAGKAVPGAVGDRMRHQRAQPADQRFERRIQDECARGGDEQIDRQSPALSQREDDRRSSDYRPEHAVATQPGNGLDHGDERGVTRNQAIDTGRAAVVGRFQWRPLQAHEDKQDCEDRRRRGDRDQRRETAA